MSNAGTNKKPKNYNRFPDSKREEWEKIFPSFTTREEIGLVDGLVKYNPKQRLTAAEVSATYKLFTGFLTFLYFQALCQAYFGIV